MARKSPEEKWRDVLMGEARGHICWSPWMRRISRAIPTRAASSVTTHSARRETPPVSSASAGRRA
jgi:hypothetical protein